MRLSHERKIAVKSELLKAAKDGIHFLVLLLKLFKLSLFFFNF